MAEYKDIDEILKKLPDDLPYKASVKRVLMQAPEADVVEVVRCKECEYWEEITLDNTDGYFSPEELLGLPFRLPIRSLGEGICQCEHWEGRVVDDKFLAFVEQLKTTAHDFCSFGERKNKGGE